MITDYNYSPRPSLYSYFFLTFLIILLTVLMLSDIILFNFISELIPQVYGLMIFALYWNRLTEEDSVMIRFIGIGFLFVSVINLAYIIFLVILLDSEQIIMLLIFSFGSLQEQCRP